MNQIYERDFDLNLLRVFVVVAEAGSVTGAAERLYLTQPAISAALRRLTGRVGEALFAREGRGLTLTTRGKRLLDTAQPHLAALIGAALAPAAFDPETSEDTVRIGLSDANESWLLSPLLRVLRREAPRLKLVILPIQFRTVADAFAEGRLDLALTVADDLPAGTGRKPLFFGGFVCLFDPRSLDFPKRPTIERYLAEEHVIVSYNGDLRGVVEDLLGLRRKVRISVPTFTQVGAALDGTGLVATVPDVVARDSIKTRPHLRTAIKPFGLSSTPMELLWRKAAEGEGAVSFVRKHIEHIAAQISPPKKTTPRHQVSKKS
ncbi:MAG TPA: LysR family transcriptional regulator [Polyangiaceae bacterium]|nr:LysR family transcriptional regulator [Polyangiaceae bacterium]